MLHFVLISRSMDAMQALATRLESASERVRTSPVACDLSSAVFSLARGDEYDKLDALLSELAVRSDRVTLVHNAGSIGSLRRIVKYDPSVLAQLPHLYALNVSSVVALTMLVLSRFGAEAALARAVDIVNVSSLLAVQAHPCWGLYAMHKAAREMFLNVLASEHGARAKLDGGAAAPAPDAPDATAACSPALDLRVLNYAPGPMDTAMQAMVRAEIDDEAQRVRYCAMHESNELVSCADSAAKLVGLLRQEQPRWHSGAHVDFYDV